MANKSQLRIILSKNIKNKKSKHEDKKCQKVVNKVIDSIEKKMNVELEWHSNIYLKDIVETLKQSDKNIDFSDVKKTSNIRHSACTSFISSISQMLKRHLILDLMVVYYIC